MERIIINSSEAKAGVKALKDLVGGTMGPYGFNVMPFAQNMSQVFRDGFKVITTYVPDGVIQLNMVQRLRDAASMTHLLAGDGTSTTTVFLATLYLTALAEIEDSEAGGVKVMRRLVAEKVTMLLTRMVEELEKMAVKDIGDDVLIKVATLAAANDPVIGAKVAEFVRQIGPTGGVMPPEYSRSGKLETEVAPGFVFQAGLYDKGFLPMGGTSVRIDNPVVIVIDDELTLYEDMAPLIHQYEKEYFNKGVQRPLVFICRDMGGVALATMLLREHKGTGITLPFYCIRYPQVNPGQFTEDIAAVTGARPINKMKGYLMKNFNMAKDGGEVESMTVNMTRTVISRKESDSAMYDGLIQRLEKQIEELANADVELLQAAKDRLSALRGMVGVIRIPGATQGALNWKKEVVEDAVRAAQSALTHGVLPGCGRALIAAQMRTFAYEVAEEFDSLELKIAEIAVLEAAHSVFRQVARNAGVSERVLPWLVESFQYNVDVAKTYLVNEDFVKAARHFDADLTDLGATDKGIYMKKSIVDAFDAGVLDSAHAVIVAVKHSMEEFRLWIQTERWVL